ncbi:MAG TPA: protein-methionine-sulfoxide reductase catalytic subunit MsrP [Gemmatimonadaceae bacterium]|nr:protein-methionine-sulfoxide reductase catalytic subunit MsrP [Gemmatimonadaceae bacterium]
MIIKRGGEIPSSEITPEHAYANRREFLKAAGLTGIGLSAVGAGLLAASRAGAAQQKEEPTSFERVTTYNNFYEFGTGKEDPAQNARNFRTKPWTIKVDGLVKKPGDYALEDFIKPSTVQERVYRMRCVEAWSMIIPWNGIPLADVIKRAEPTAGAQYVEFTTLLDPEQMPEQKFPTLHWPYIEGLRLDEAMHPLAILATGLYNKPLLPQNGAPIRLVTPWKYGFKGGKSIVRIRLTAEQPVTAWVRANAHEYGFYANVNPQVDHPRWSQASERRVGEFNRRPTLMFNGYADQVASLYSGMDLRRFY